MFRRELRLSEMTVTMKDKVVELAEVVVGKKNKPQKIAGKAVSGPTASFRGKGKVDGTEWGPVFKSKKDYVISDILLTIKGTSYQWCVLSFNIYEIQGDKFVNILNKPIYQRIEKSNGKQRLDIRPEETIVLKGKKKYLMILMSKQAIFSRQMVLFGWKGHQIEYIYYIG